MVHRILKACFLFIPPAFALIFVIGSPFQNYSVESTTTKLVSFGSLYIYHYPNNQEIPKDVDGKYVITQNDLEKSDLSKTVFHTLFGNTQGWYAVCFHNVNSTFYLLDYNTGLSEPVIFGFNNKDITVLPDETNCDNVITYNQKFSIIINNKGVKSPDEKIALDFVKNDKGFLEYAKKNHIDASTIDINANFVPYLVGEVYLTPYFLTYFVGYFITLFVWAGIIFTFQEIKKFLAK